MGAMPEELVGILELIRDRRRVRIGDRDFWVGRRGDIEIVAVFSRWGKVASAATAAILATQFKVDHILFVGVAGGADPDVDLGDVVVASELVQHDMDASAIPSFARFEIPLLGRTRFETSAVLANEAQVAAREYLLQQFDNDISLPTRMTLGVGEPKVVSGLIASGDYFMSDAAKLNELRTALPGLLCVEMEGAAVAQVCFELAVGLTVVRIISDRADHAASVDFPRFVAEAASVMTKGIAKRFLDRLHLHVRDFTTGAGRPSQALAPTT
jgi:adenosylhomocysteine nucleosidase